MKTNLKIGIAAGVVTIAICGTQIGTTYNQTKQFVREMKIQLAQDRETAIIARDTEMKLAMGFDRGGTPNIVGSTADSVTEQFKITEKLDNGYIRGEKTEGTGEGIYYSADTFKKYGADDLAIGDIVNVTWPIDSYEAEEWDNLLKIERVAAN